MCVSRVWQVGKRYCQVATATLSLTPPTVSARPARCACPASGVSRPQAACCPRAAARAPAQGGRCAWLWLWHWLWQIPGMRSERLRLRRIGSARSAIALGFADFGDFLGFGGGSGWVAVAVGGWQWQWFGWQWHGCNSGSGTVATVAVAEWCQW
jgi:hypothetical protein